jgi:hypothetical protein
MVRLVIALTAWLIVVSRALGGDSEFAAATTIDLRAPPGDRAAFWGSETLLPEWEHHFCNEGVRIPALFGSFQVGGLFVTRSHANASPTSKLFSQTNDGLLLDAGDLDLGTNFGLDVTAIVRLNRALGIETRYFGVTDWAASREVTDPGGSGVRFEGFGVTLPSVSGQLDYASRFYSLEINVLPLVTEGVPLVLGFRGFQLHERFELWQTDPLPKTLALNNRANNYLYGFQIGAEPYLMGAGGAFRVDGLIKAGIYGNHASQATFSPVLGPSAQARRDVAAFGGEAGLAIVYRINRSFALRGGYELIWLSQVALAPNQSRKTELAAPYAQLDLGSAFMHGATASLEFAF